MKQSAYYRESGLYGCQLVRSVKEESRLVQYQLQILTRSKPDWLVPCYLRFRAGMPQICHDLAGLKSLDMAFTGKDLCCTNGLIILRKLFIHLAAAEDMLLPINQMPLHPSMIHCRNELSDEVELQLIFWPISQQDSDMKIIETVVDSLADSFEIPEYPVNIIKSEFKQGGIKKLAAFLESHDLDALCANPEVHNQLQTVSKPALDTQWVRKIWFDFIENVRSHINRLFQILSNWLQNQAQEDLPLDNQTVLMPADPINFRMALISAGKPGTPEENEGLRAYILVDEFLIGRDAKFCDLSLNEPGIGRQHVRIIRRAGSFYICDLGSRNGSRLDGKRLLKNVEMLLPDQCLLQFADQSFYFQAD